MSTGPPTGSPDDREVIMQLGSQNPPEEPKDQMNERQAVHQVLTHIGSGSELETEREQSEEGAAVDQVITHLGGPMDAEMDEPERVITHLGQKPAPEGTGVSDAAEEEAIQLAESLPDELLPKFLVQGKKKTRNMGEMSVLEAMEEIKVALLNVMSYHWRNKKRGNCPMSCAAEMCEKACPVQIVHLGAFL